jgi:hypothetical protein
MKKITLGWMAGLTLAVIFLWGCSSTVHVEKDDSANFKRYHTFAWIKDDQKEQKINSIVEQSLQGAVNKELEKAGWRESKNAPDVLLSYDVLVEKTVKDESNPVYSQPYSRLYYNPYTRRFGTIYFPSQFMGYDNDQRVAREGTLTISMMDTRTDKTVWQGWTTDELSSSRMTSRDVQSSVKSIFRKFDTAQK